jgi:hypothetical protein
MREARKKDILLAAHRSMKEDNIKMKLREMG